MEDINAELVSFIREEIADYKLVITYDLSIEDDFGISGDDACDFIISFSKRFNVGIAKFVFSNYFHSECSFFDRMTDKKPLTVGMLEQALKSGRLE